MNDLYAPRPIARWYMPAALVALLLMAFYCALQGMDLATDPATLDPDQRALTEAEQTWVIAASWVAALSGLAGSLLLVLKRRQAEPFMLVSLVAILVWLAGVLAGPMRDLLAGGDLAVVVIVVAIFWTIYWFARHSRQRGWLR